MAKSRKFRSFLYQGRMYQFDEVAFRVLVDKKKDENKIKKITIMEELARLTNRDVESIMQWYKGYNGPSDPESVFSLIASYLGVDETLLMKPLAFKPGTMKVVAIGNILGGQGKSVISHNFAAVLSQRGYNVLMIDGDGLAAFNSYVEPDNKPTLKDVIYNRKLIREVSQKGKYFDFVLGSSCIRLDGIDTEDIIIYLQKQLEALNAFYDYIVIDLPAGNLKLNRLFAAVVDELIIPITEYLSVEGIRDYITDMMDMKKYNPKLSFRGFLLNRIDEERESIDYLYKKVFDNLNQDGIYRIFCSSIRDSYLMPYFAYEKKFICDYEKHLGIRQDFEHVVDEYLAG